MRRIALVVDVASDGTGYASVELYGIITNVYRVYNGQGAGVDGVLKEEYQDGSTRTLLTVTNSNTNGAAPLKVNDVDASNSAITGSYSNESVAGTVSLTVTGGTEIAAGVVWYLTVIDA